MLELGRVYPPTGGHFSDRGDINSQPGVKLALESPIIQVSEL